MTSVWCLLGHSGDPATSQLQVLLAVFASAWQRQQNWAGSTNHFSQFQPLKPVCSAPVWAKLAIQGQPVIYKENRRHLAIASLRSLIFLAGFCHSQATERGISKLSCFYRPRQVMSITYNSFHLSFKLLHWGNGEHLPQLCDILDVSIIPQVPLKIPAGDSLEPVSILRGKLGARLQLAFPKQSQMSAEKDYFQHPGEHSICLYYFLVPSLAFWHFTGLTACIVLSCSPTPVPFLEVFLVEQSITPASALSCPLYITWMRELTDSPSFVFSLSFIVLTEVMRMMRTTNLSLETPGSFSTKVSQHTAWQ